MSDLSGDVISVDTSTSRINVPATKFSYKWTIDNFTSCATETGERLTSPMFSPTDNDGLKWCLAIYPCGQKAECKDSVSLFLRLVSCDESELMVSYDIYVIDVNEKTTCGLKCTELLDFSSGGWFGQTDYVKRKYLLADASNLLPDDKLTILCVIKMCIPQISERKANQYRLLSSIEQLLENKKLSDVTINVFGREISAHKMILGSCSPVFSAMFEHKLEENNQNRVDINDIDYEVVREMLRFIYTGSVTNIDENADRLLMAADKYGLEELKNLCERKLKIGLAVESAADILVLADLHSCVKLKDATIEFIRNHIDDVLETASFKTIVQSNPILTANILRSFASMKHS